MEGLWLECHFANDSVLEITSFLPNEDFLNLSLVSRGTYRLLQTRMPMLQESHLEKYCYDPEDFRELSFKEKVASFSLNLSLSVTFIDLLTTKLSSKKEYETTTKEFCKNVIKNLKSAFPMTLTKDGDLNPFAVSENFETIENTHDLSLRRITQSFLMFSYSYLYLSKYSSLHGYAHGKYGYPKDEKRAMEAFETYLNDYKPKDDGELYYQKYWFYDEIGSTDEASDFLEKSIEFGNQAAIFDKVRLVPKEGQDSLIKDLINEYSFNNFYLVASYYEKSEGIEKKIEFTEARYKAGDPDAYANKINNNLNITKEEFEKNLLNKNSPFYRESVRALIEGNLVGRFSFVEKSSFDEVKKTLQKYRFIDNFYFIASLSPYVVENILPIDIDTQPSITQHYQVNSNNDLPDTSTLDPNSELNKFKEFIKECLE